MSCTCYDVQFRVNVDCAAMHEGALKASRVSSDEVLAVEICLVRMSPAFPDARATQSPLTPHSYVESDLDSADSQECTDCSARLHAPAKLIWWLCVSSKLRVLKSSLRRGKLTVRIIE